MTRPGRSRPADPPLTEETDISQAPSTQRASLGAWPEQSGPPVEREAVRRTTWVGGRTDRTAAPRSRPPGSSSEPTAPTRQPLYSRLLRLRHIHPNVWQRALLGEGAVTLAIVLVLADLASAWTLLVLPVVVAMVVKAHDWLAGFLKRPPKPPKAPKPPKTAKPPKTRKAAEPSQGPAPSGRKKKKS